MSGLRLLVTTLAALLFVPPAPAWNFVTHRVIAAIAYDQLKPSTRARVDALIRLHPDYVTLFTRNAPADEPALARAAFIEAAVWADQIRSDPRFYEDSRADAALTPVLPGFPGMKRHTAWHFIDLPFSQDGTPLEPAAEPNLVTALETLAADITRPRISASLQAYDLVWLIHLFGDVHAPLHCTARFAADQPKGDQGGNLVFVSSGQPPVTITLHKYWDDAIGTDQSPDWIASTAQEIVASHPAQKTSSRPPRFTPAIWAQESLTIAKTEIYSFGREGGSREHPLALAAGYDVNARRVAEDQVAKAAVRLSAFLNLRLK